MIKRTFNASYYSSKYSLLPLYNARIRVGLLGGSFNPPHHGHVHVSLEAIRKFDLAYVIWLVTPQNPFKPITLYSQLSTRVAKSLAITKPYSNKIKITDIEKFFRNTYSANTVSRIKQMHQNAKFYWIMGGDNIFHIHKWHMWEQIFNITRVALCERNETLFKVKNTKVANTFNCQHLSNVYNPKGNHNISKKTNFVVLHIKKVIISSTQIRDARAKFN